MDKKKVIVVGGGTAGWISAAVIAAKHRSDVSVTLVESPDVPIIGVGEGTWPSMRATLKKIGLSETEMLRETQGSFKQGTRFFGWSDGGSEEYLHPFSLPLEYPATTSVQGWLAAQSEDVAFASTVTPQDAIVKSNKAPKQLSAPEYAFSVNYGYHFDAGKFALLLKRHCVDVLGVEYVSANVEAALPNSSGDGIGSLRLDIGQDLSGDLFLDCTGQKALLIEKFFGVGSQSVSEILFNDRAIAVQVPYDNEKAEIASATVSTAASAGWIWDIGLQNRRGVGQVYSSSFVNEDHAQQSLCDYVRQTAPNIQIQDLSFKHLKFESGYRRRLWESNCIAVGLSAGFVEPLEASAIAMVEQSAEFIAEHLGASWASMPAVARKFNDKMGHHWGRIVEFLKLHYVLNRRVDSEYWVQNRNRETCPTALLDNLEIWKHQIPGISDLPRVDELFPAASYQYVIYGMQGKGLAGEANRSRSCLAAAEKIQLQVSRKKQELMQTLPTNRHLLTRLCSHP